ncbi:hypothetical protein [Alkalibacterium sp. 20]|uniref:hypothetical protein n=1 Tax=Alkalibacterium sp. 20 TaxID=1798803 RepID=UPI0009000B44|nr:hypothetical protein [Alkalibacterium sp. 20]OJF93748.1 hypothetical protein AX762_08660 [Alkalibacterium sp. 20]
MEQTVYTNYWQNRLTGVKKKHGSYATEEEAINGIKAWWELHNEYYPHAEYKRTNSGALEIIYNDDNYIYRIEKRKTENPLPKAKAKPRNKNEVTSIREKYGFHDEALLYEELAEPYRDRLMLAMNDSKKLHQYVFDLEGRPIKKFNDR